MRSNDELGIMNYELEIMNWKPLSNVGNFDIDSSTICIKSVHKVRLFAYVLCIKLYYLHKICANSYYICNVTKISMYVSQGHLSRFIAAPFQKTGNGYNGYEKSWKKYGIEVSYRGMGKTKSGLPGL